MQQEFNLAPPGLAVWSLIELIQGKDFMAGVMKMYGKHRLPELSVSQIARLSRHS
jgi:hypothetical protein